jgi:hemerythrin-like domain-containing protein
MLRDKSLIPLSHQHQHALALCVRIQRAQPIPVADLLAWQAEIEQLFEQEIKIHFAAEERLVFPVARSFLPLRPLVEELLTDHASLREYFSQAQARSITTEGLGCFAQRLSEHIRKEERELFQCLQKLMNSEDLAKLGNLLDAAMKDATSACIVPSKTTKLKPKDVRQMH